MCVKICNQSISVSLFANLPCNPTAGVLKGKIPYGQLSLFYCVGSPCALPREDCSLEVGHQREVASVGRCYGCNRAFRTVGVARIFVVQVMCGGLYSALGVIMLEHEATFAMRYPYAVAVQPASEPSITLLLRGMRNDTNSDSNLPDLL